MRAGNKASPSSRGELGEQKFQEGARSCVILLGYFS